MNLKGFRDRHVFAFVSVVVLVFIYLSLETDDKHESVTGGHEVVFTKQAQDHVLYGDSKGGGHLYGSGQPCKSEFPKSWSVEQIIYMAKMQAANDNVAWKQGNNGYYISEKMHGNVRVRVVMDDDRSHIITVYPANLPKNPCK